MMNTWNFVRIIKDEQYFELWKSISLIHGMSDTI